MKTITVRANEVSQPYYAGAGSRITLTGSGRVEWAAVEKLQDALNGATWNTWPAGSTAGYRDTERGLAVRVVGAGACSVTIEEGKGDPANEGAYWQGVGDNATVITDPITGEIEILSGGKRTVFERKYRPSARIGDLLTDWAGATIVANGTPASGTAGLVTEGLAPTGDGGYAVRLIGDGATRAEVTNSFPARSSADFRGVAFWARVKGRTVGNSTTQLFLGADSGFAKNVALTLGIPNDGKWHLMYVSRQNFGVSGFVYGTDSFTHIKFKDRYGSTIGFPGMLTNAEELQIGPVYINPWSRPKFLIRFDDSLSDCIVPNGTFTADGVTQAWSALTLLDKYGFRDKGSCFHLTRRIGTSNSVKTFLTESQIAQLANEGWSHCFQSDFDPVDGANSGLRLMGPDGFTARTVASVDTTADTITSSVAHNISSGSVYWGYPVVFSGTDLPAPLVVGVEYWARYVSATAMSLHPTEDAAIANTGKIDLTTTGTVGNFTWRYSRSANDQSAILQDFQTGIARLTAMGYGETATIYAPNQGATDVRILATAKAAGVTAVLGISNTSADFKTVATRHPHMETTGFPVGPNYEISDSFFTLPGAVQTDGAPNAQNVRDYVRAVIKTGGIGSNYHHSITASNGPVLAAYLDELRAGVLDGSCDVVTAQEMADYLSVARRAEVGVVF